MSEEKITFESGATIKLIGEDNSSLHQGLDTPINLERAYRIAKELRWRIYPNECPTTGDILVQYQDGGIGMGGAVHYGRCSYSFKWLPLSALKVLDE